MWWILGYLEIYERRPASAGAGDLSAQDTYELVVGQFGSKNTVTIAEMT
jgi:hypothetical protein